jgi:hypothetical protein
MPEAKNTFLQGKMNKDLDARLLKNGEYFDAQNIHISKSESSDVGTVQNILGNKLNYTTGAFKSGERTIGIVTTNTSDGTNAAGAGYSGVPNVTSGFTTNGNGVGGSVNIIIDGGAVTKVTLSGTASGYKVGDTITISKDTGTPAIGGSTSVVLTLREEDLLITEDVGTVIGYLADSEAKSGIYTIYYFVKGNSGHKDNIYYYQESVTAPIPLINNTDDFLKFDTNFLITGVNIIDDLLFWTDNKNQPRKINTVTAIADNTYYDNEDKISVAKYYPYTAPKVLRQVDGTDHGGMQLLKTTARLNGAANSTVFDIDEDDTHDVHVGQEIYDGTTFLGKVTAVSANGAQITSDTAVNKSDNTVLTFLNQNDRLKEKFVRFAYRFKYKDGEYSLISPFTQHCFIPQTYNIEYTGHNAIGLTSAQQTDAAETTELASFINDVAHVNLQIEFPSDEPTKDFEIEKIEILIKESDRPDIKSLAQLNITNDSVSTDKIYNYTYKGTLPYKTLPERQLTRAYDNVPVKAKAQEIIGNRLVYGNYQEGSQNKPFDNDLSYSFDYHISVGTKNDTEFKFDKQYPYHSIKTRRTYQAGIVLVDRYGRQSPVFLSDDVDNSLVKVKAKDSSQTDSTFSGEVLEISFNKKIPVSDKEGNSVLYNSITNPTGWYSYKVVVKQNEQDYYNVYAPSAKDGIPNARVQHSHSSLYYTDADKRTWLVLHGDNINKVPRDTTQESVDDNSVFPTDVDLFPKVNAGLTNIMDAGPLLDIISVGKAMDHGLELFDEQQSGSDQEKNHTYLIFHNWKKNPLLAELPEGYGETITMSNLSSNPADQSPLDFISSIGFSVWETKPFESSLDLYYETVTCGLISTLNTEILATSSAQPASIKFDDDSTTTSFAEGLDAGANGQAIGPNLKTLDQSGNAITSNITYSIVSVIKDGVTPPLQTTAETHFGISEAGGNSKIKVTNNKFYYGNSGHVYTVRVKVVNTANQSAEQDFTVNLTNTTPALTVPETATHPHFSSNGIIFSPSSALNGSADSTQNTTGITHSIESVTYDPTGANETTDTHKNKFTINTTTGAVSANNHTFPDSEVGKVYKIVTKINDGSGQTSTNTHTDFCNVTIGGWLWGNFRFSTGFNGICPAYCGTGSTQSFYVKRPATNTSTSLTIQVGDLVYSNATLTTAVNQAYVLTQIVGGEDGTGLNTEVTGGAVQSIDNDNLCSGYTC